MKRFAAVRVLVFALALYGVAAVAVTAQTPKRPLTIDDLLKVRRVGDPQLSPDGKWIAYQISDPDKEANRSRTQIYLVSIAGGQPIQLTTGESSASSPRWSPDGRRIAFVRGGQIHTMDARGGDIKKVTSISTGAGDPVWSPDGRMLAFVSDIYPDCRDDACNQKRDADAEASKVKAKTIDRLLFRHWTAFKDGKRTHVFVVSADGASAARDMTPGDYDAPPFSLGGQTDYAFSPDSRELAFARNTEKVEATSTNNDIFIVPLAGGDAVRLTGDNPGSDQSPLYSPDGRYLAYRSQATAGFESARWRLMIYDRQTRKTRELTSKFDAYVDGFTFTPDGKSIYFVSGERGRQPLYMLSINDGQLTKVFDGFNDDVRVAPDGETLVFTRSSSIQPTEIYRYDFEGGHRVVAQITRTNDAFMANF
ncbi:MAG TPA: hypothetical protein VGO96_02820, partial [Pyrinomonadaceae bacterium]|nr:hypothetical protein [Pyrinomonadaceae bacterium]